MSTSFVDMGFKFTNDVAIVNFFGDLPRQVQIALSDKWNADLASMLAEIKDVKLNGVVLNRKRGALAESVSGVAAVRYGNRVRIVIKAGGPSAPYARIHEFGGKTAPHEIAAKNGKTLAFVNKYGQRIFPERVQHPGSVMPERSYIRSTVSEWRARIQSEISAVLDPVLKGSGFQ